MHTRSAAICLGVLLCSEATLRAQAEPAPPDFVPAAPPSVPPVPPPPKERPPRVRVAAGLRLSGLLGDTQTVAAPLGWGFGLQLSASLLPIGPARLGFVVDFAQDRFSRPLSGVPDPPQLLLHNTFAGLVLFDLPTRYLRPHLAFGPGLSVARHEAPPIDETSELLATATLPLLRFSFGLGFSPVRWLEIGLSGEISLTFSDQRGGVLDRGETLAPGTATIFAPGWWSSVLWAGYRFY